LKRIPARVAVLGLMLLTLAAVTAVALSGVAESESTYYVALGDSLARGYQPTGGPSDRSAAPPGSDHGYADQLYKSLRGNSTRLQLVKLGCVGETSVTIDTGEVCRYRGRPQLQSALTFVRANRSAVKLVTIDLGTNDVIHCVFTRDQHCFDAGIASLRAHLPPILKELENAVTPGTPIVGMTYYNLFAGKPGAEMTDSLNAALEELYAAAGIPVADVAGAFAANPSSVCDWTWFCSKYGDVHANTEGYGVIARTFAGVLRA
jgi:lysophospholipase L1-like esterase